MHTQSGDRGWPLPRRRPVSIPCQEWPFHGFSDMPPPALSSCDFALSDFISLRGVVGRGAGASSQLGLPSPLAYLPIASHALCKSPCTQARRRSCHRFILDREAHCPGRCVEATQSTPPTKQTHTRYTNTISQSQGKLAPCCARLRLPSLVD